jgi:hypothetical protein
LRWAHATTSAVLHSSRTGADGASPDGSGGGGSDDGVSGGDDGVAAAATEVECDGVFEAPSLPRLR